MLHYCLNSSASIMIPIFIFIQAVWMEPYKAGATAVPSIAPSAVPAQMQTYIRVLSILYDKTGGDSWFENSNWLKGDNACDWFGVTCSQGHVNGVSLPGNNLVGFLPTELGHLKSLETLHLNSNAITSTLPSEISRLSSSLKGLSLDENHMTGPLPSELGLLNLLESFVLRENTFSSSIPTEIGMMSSLKYFDLTFNNFTGAVPTEIGYMIQLESIKLGANNFSGSINREICSDSINIFVVDCSIRCTCCTDCIESPSNEPSAIPSKLPSRFPTKSPSFLPSLDPSVSPTSEPSIVPSAMRSMNPSASKIPSISPTIYPSRNPTINPSQLPTLLPTILPTDFPTFIPSENPTSVPSVSPSVFPTIKASGIPSTEPSISHSPSTTSSLSPSAASDSPSKNLSLSLSLSPSRTPSVATTSSPSVTPTVTPSSSPSVTPSLSPSATPSVTPSLRSSSRTTDTPSSIPTFPSSGVPTFSTSPSKKPSFIFSSFPSQELSIIVENNNPSYDSSGSPSYQQTLDFEIGLAATGVPISLSNTSIHEMEKDFQDVTNEGLQPGYLVVLIENLSNFTRRSKKYRKLMVDEVNVLQFLVRIKILENDNATYDDIMDLLVQAIQSGLDDLTMRWREIDGLSSILILNLVQVLEPSHSPSLPPIDTVVKEDSGVFGDLGLAGGTTLIAAVGFLLLINVVLWKAYIKVVEKVDERESKENPKDIQSKALEVLSPQRETSIPPVTHNISTTFSESFDISETTPIVKAPKLDVVKEESKVMIDYEIQEEIVPTINRRKIIDGYAIVE